MQNERLLRLKYGRLLNSGLFAWTTNHAGDLLHFFKGHFDTTIGLKVESPSYDNITKAIGVAPEHTLFATDNILEVHTHTPSLLSNIQLTHHLRRPTLLRRPAGTPPWPTGPETRLCPRATTSQWWTRSTSSSMAPTSSPSPRTFRYVTPQCVYPFLYILTTSFNLLPSVSGWPLELVVVFVFVTHTLCAKTLKRDAPVVIQPRYKHSFFFGWVVV